jgi:hypothetical protein
MSGIYKELTSPAWSNQGIHLREEVLRKNYVRAGSFNTHYMSCYVPTFGIKIAPSDAGIKRVDALSPPKRGRGESGWIMVPAPT